MYVCFYMCKSICMSICMYIYKYTHTVNYIRVCACASALTEYITHIDS